MSQLGQTFQKQLKSKSKAMTNIPAGYTLTISSWENDADNYADKTLHGLSEADVRFYINLLNRFRSHNSGGLGNEDYEPEQETAAIEAAFNESPPDSLDLLDEVKVSLSEYRDDPQFMENILETWGHEWGSTKWRVFERFQVNYVPVECPDCTSQFSLN